MNDNSFVGFEDQVKKLHQDRQQSPFYVSCEFVSKIK